MARSLPIYSSVPPTSPRLRQTSTSEAPPLPVAAAPCRAPTYDLRVNGNSSAAYYVDVRNLAREFLDQATWRLGWFKRDNQLDFREWAFGLLVTVTLWRIYGNRALRAPRWGLVLLKSLAIVRRRYPQLKRLLDPWRGLAMSFFLALDIRTQSRGVPRPSDLERLAAWLEATGDFVQEALRVRRCIADCSSQFDASRAQLAVSELTDWFSRRSQQCLGCYTTEVTQYLAREHAKRRHNEDFVSTGRSPLEYHLNMLGAELLNDAFYVEFSATQRRIVALPACMRAEHGLQCRATSTSLGMQCARCNPECTVHRIVRHVAPVGLEVVVVIHSSSYLQWLQHPELQEDAGIIGVACVPNLLTGGWEAKAAGVPAQCVLLDFSGCTKHWHSRGLATELNIQKLIELAAPSGNTSPDTRRSH